MSGASSINADVADDHWVMNFASIPAHWSCLEFDAVFENVPLTGLKVPQKEYEQFGRYPVIDQGSGLVGGYTNDADRILSLPRPAIVFGDHTKCFKYLSTPFAPGADGIKVLLPKEGILEKYVYHLCKSLRLPDRGYSRHFSFLKKCKFPMPPIEEQKDIVAMIESLLSELDSGIESLKTAREQLKVYRQAVLKHAFEGKLTAQWREENKDKLESPERLLTRIPVPSQPRGGREASREVIEGIGALAVNKPKKNVPEGWVWTPLLRVARQETGHTPSRRKPEYWGGHQYWIGIVDARLHHGQKINDTLQKVTSEGLENSSARILPSETVCLSRTASVGYVCIMGKPMATSQDFATWSCTEALDSKFLMYAIIAEGSEIRRFGKGTTHTTIYFPEIRALHIALPSVTEQRTIVDLLEKKLQYVDLVLNDINEQILRTETLRQSILKKAFTGQLATITEDQEST